MRRLLLAAGVGAACASAGGRPAPPPVPAVIVEPTPQSRVALLQAVTDALGARPLLAEDALTRDSSLIVERKNLEGRELGVPERFLLWQIGGACVLEHERTGRRSPLVATRCAAR